MKASTFKKLILFFILLNITLTAAEEIILNIGETKEFKSIPITLIKVGSYGSAQLKIGQMEKMLPANRIEEVQGMSFRLRESAEEFVKLEVTMIAECLEDSDCNDDIDNTRDLCILRECTHDQTDCCMLGTECRQVSSIAEISGVSNYCGSDFKWAERKAYKSPCIRDYECSTSYCDGYCKISQEFGRSYQGEKMAPAWVLIVIGSLIILSSFIFIINPKQGKRIYENIFKNFSAKTFKILAIIFCLIAIALIIWALI